MNIHNFLVEIKLVGHICQRMFTFFLKYTILYDTLIWLILVFRKYFYSIRSTDF